MAYKLTRFFYRLLFFVLLFLILTIGNTNACNYTFINLSGTPINNGNGTYTINIQVCIAVTISWGGTTSFSMQPVGGTFTTISAFSPTTLISNYNYCSTCATTCLTAPVAVTATVTGILNGANTVVNYNQTTSTPSTGCTPPAACWGSGYPFIPDDYQAVCVSNPNYLCWTITLVTNGYPAFISVQGAEDDIGPDIGQAGNPGCPESVIMPTLSCNPAVSINPVTPAICSGQSIILTASGSTSYSWSPSTGLNSTTGSTVTASPYYTTIYTVTGTPGGCTASVTVVVNPLPNVTVSPNITICQGQPTTLVANGAATYSWSPPAGLSATTGSTVTASPASTTTYTVTGTSNNGCSGTATTTVTVVTMPTASITAAGPVNFCAPGTVTLNANTGTGLSYQWRINGGNIPGATSASYVATASGNYDCIVTNTCGSATSNVIAVTVILRPPANIIASGATEFCAPGSVTLNANTGTGLSYQWRLNAGNIAGATAASYIASVTGSYDCIVSNFCGGTISNGIYVLVEVLPSAVITAAGPTTFCSPGSVTLNANTGTGLSYQWQLNTNIILGATLSTYTASATGNYNCIVTNSCGSVTSNTIAVIVNPGPIASITAAGPVNFCAPGSVMLSANTGPGLSYQWRQNTTNISGATAAAYIATATGTYDCMVTNSCGSTISNSIYILAEILPTAVITAAGPASFCPPGSVTLNANTGTGLSYQWRLNAGNISGATTSSYVATAAGNYDCMITNTCGTRQSNSILVSVDVFPAAIISASGPTEFCSPGSVTLNANMGLGLSYQWRLNAGNIPGAIASSYVATASGNYDCVVTNTCGSASSNAIAVTVNLLPPASITAAGATIFCSPGSVTLNANTGTGLLYQWRLNAGNISGATASFYVSAAAGNYDCIVTNTCGSVASNVIAVTVNQLPPASITAAGATTFCEGDSVTLNANTGTGLSYQWRLNAGDISGATASYYVAAAAGSYDCMVTNTCGSVASNAIAVTVNQVSPASITASGATTLCAGGNVTLTSSAGSSYLWNTNATTSSINVTASGNYFVTVTNSAGCTAVSLPTTVTVNMIVTASVSITPSVTGSVTPTTSITFTATAVNGGSAPFFQWKKNGVNVGTNSNTYTDNSWVNLDVMKCEMTSNATCVMGSPATSNLITVYVNTSGNGIPRFVVSDVTANQAYYYDSAFAFIMSNALSTNVLNGNANASDVFMTATNGYISDGVVSGKVYRSSQALSAGVVSRTLRSNTGAILNPTTGLSIRGDTLYVLDKKSKAIYYYYLSLAYNGSPATLNAFVKKTLLTTNNSAEALSFDEIYFYVLENDNNTKAIYRYTLLGTAAGERSRPLLTNTGAALLSIKGIAVDGNTVWVTDNGTDRAYPYDKIALFTGSNTVALPASTVKILNSGNLNSTGISVTNTSSLLRQSENEEQEDLLVIKAWPNPTSGNINISLEGFDPIHNVVMHAFDMTGRMISVREEPGCNNEFSPAFDLTGLKPGIYSIVIDQGTIRKTVRVLLK